MGEEVQRERGVGWGGWVTVGTVGDGKLLECLMRWRDMSWLILSKEHAGCVLRDLGQGDQLEGCCNDPHEKPWWLRP